MAQTTTQRQALFSAIDAISADIRGTQKSAADNSNGGPTSFPSVDDPTKKPVHTGALYADNSTEVKKQNPDTIEEATEPSPTQDKQLEVNTGDGIKPSAVGEDPAVEDAYKSTIKDPGTESPARFDDGQKYAKMAFPELLVNARQLSDKILAEIVGDQSKVAAATAVVPNAAVAAGMQLAAAVGVDKNAAVDNVDFIANTISDAELEADLFAQHYITFSKQAADDPAGDKRSPEDAGAPPESGTPAAPPSAPSPAGDAAAMDPGAMLGMGGGDPGQASLAAQPPSQDEAMNQLMAAMAEQGITPEMLLALLQDSSGGAPGMDGAGAASPPAAPPGGDPAGGGPMPGAGGPPTPPPMADKMASRRTLHEMLEKISSFQQAGKFRFEATKSARERTLRDMMGRYIGELVRTAR